MESMSEVHSRMATFGFASALLMCSQCTNDGVGAVTPQAPQPQQQSPVPAATSDAGAPSAAMQVTAAAGAPAPTTSGATKVGANPAQTPGPSQMAQTHAATTPPTSQPAASAPKSGAQTWPDPRGGCPGLNSGFPGDEACIAPPPAAEGIQIHVGPKNYADQTDVAQFVMHPGEESSECWSYHTPNMEDVYFQGYTLSGRPGTHHIFNSMLKVEVTDGGGFHVCVDAGLGNSPDRLGSLPGAARPYMPRTPVAPENEGLGQLLHANTPSEADMHYFNASDHDLLREFWMNLYFIPKEQVTQQGVEVRGMGGLSWVGLPIEPGTDEVYKYECPVNKDGRLISMLGHYHSHGKRSTVSIRRASGMREMIYEMYDYNNAALFPFDSVTTNPPLTGMTDGAVSGRIDIKAGDVIEWECHIINDSNIALTYTNSVKEGEMCNIFGMSVGTEINCLLP